MKKLLAVTLILCLLGTVVTVPVSANDVIVQRAFYDFEDDIGDGDETPDIGPDGVDYTPKTVWSDNFDDGNLDGWTAINGASAMTASDGAMYGTAAAGVTSGMRYSSDDLKLGGKNYSFGFKAKIAGHGTNPGRINVQSYFDTNKRITTYFGHASYTGPTFAMADGTWYEFLYVYTYDEGTAKQTADLYARAQGSDSSWSDWELLKENIELTDTTGTGRLDVYLEAINTVNQNATEVWYDDFKVYLHEKDTTIGDEFDPSTVGPDGIKNPIVIWSDNFADGNLDGWTHKTSGFEVADQMLHASATTTTGGASIQVQNNALSLNDRNFTFRFKQKMKGGTQGIGTLEVAFGTHTTDNSHNVGSSKLSMTMETWYEWAYVYSYDPTGYRITDEGNIVTGRQTLDIWSRYQTATGWSEWSQRVTDMPVNYAQGVTRRNRFTLTFPKVGGTQLATDIWYDDFQVYIHGSAPDGWVSEDGAWFLKDGTYRVENVNSTEGYYASTKFTPDIRSGEDFRMEIQLKVAALSHQQSFTLVWPGYQFVFRPRPTYFEYMASKNTVTEYAGNLMDDQFHDVVVETYDGGSKVKLIVDGVCLVNEPAQKISSSTPSLMISVASQGGRMSSLIMDSFKLDIIQGEQTEETTTPEVNGTLSASLVGNTVTASFTDFTNVDTVEYLLDGQFIGKTSTASETVTASGLYPERHTLLAVCRDSAGVVIKTFAETLVPEIDIDAGQVSTNYANDISYTVNGTATVDFSNGNHRLYLEHTQSGVNYLTDDNRMETYTKGETGNFEIITDGAVADVYHNGQLAFSYYMPTTDVIDRDLSGVTNYQEFAPEQKNNYFVKRNVTDRGATYELGEIPYYHNLDFVADQEDEVELALNDGYYQADIQFKNGKIYVLTGSLKDAKAEPADTYLADVMEGNVYYRVESAFGICRLYGNGHFMTSFQAVPGGGEGSLYLDVQKGSLDYISVNDNQDLRIFNDTFNGSGSDRFWQTENMTTSVDTGAGTVSLTPQSGKNGMIEWNAFATDFVFDATLNVTNQSGGFWLILGHSVEQSYTKIGYNFGWTNRRYEVHEVTGVNESQMLKSTSKWTSFPSGEMKVSLVAKRTGATKEVILFVNGTEAIRVDDASHRAGTFGFMLDGASITLSDVSYRGDAMIVNGLVDNEYDDGSSILRNGDMVVLDENNMFFMQQGKATRDYSSDGGRTWAQQSVSSIDGVNNNCVRLANGELLGTLLTKYDIATGTKAYKVYRSNDNGETWSDEGWMQEGETSFYSGQNRMIQTSYGRIFFVAGEGQGDESTGDVHHVYYSKDNGKSWDESENTIDPERVGMVVDEAVIVEGEGDVMRCYFRTDTGTICYVESHDKGVNWDLENVYRTPFSSAANCFNVERDSATGYLYLAWGYDNVNLCGMVQLPRTRWAVAVSKDYGKTWEYVGTGHENNQRAGMVMMNLNINVAPKNLVLTGYAATDASGRNYGDGGRRIAISKDQVSSKRFDRLHHCEEGLMGSYLDENELSKIMAVEPATNTAMVKGHRVENAVDGENIALDVAESFLGSTIAFEPEMLTEKDGRTFVALADFVGQGNLNVTEYEGIYVVSKKADWTGRQLKIVRRLLRAAGVAESVMPSGDMHRYVEETFAGDLTAPNYTISETAKVEEGTLKLNPGESFVIKDLTIPVGGYADLRLENSDAWDLILRDTKVAVEVSDIEQGTSEWLDCRIVRTGETDYKVYTKDPEENLWYLETEDSSVAMDDGDVGLRFINAGTEGVLKLDAMAVFGPSTGKNMVVIDGATTKIITNGGTSAYSGNIRVLLTPDETAAKQGFVAGYSENGNMISVEVFPIPNGNEEFGYTTTEMTDSAIDYLKVFAWGCEDMDPYLPAYVVNRK